MKLDVNAVVKGGLIAGGVVASQFAYQELSKFIAEKDTKGKFSKYTPYAAAGIGAAVFLLGAPFMKMKFVGDLLTGLAAGFVAVGLVSVIAKLQNKETKTGGSGTTPTYTPGSETIPPGGIPYVA